MDLSAPFSSLTLPLRRRKREKALQQAAAWPLITAKLLSSTVVPKDVLAEETSSYQDSQVESAFYFTLNGGYYGGHLRSIPMSDSEAYRSLSAAKEDTPIQVRYNPANPDDNHTFPADNSNALPSPFGPTDASIKECRWL